MGNDNLFCNSIYCQLYYAKICFKIHFGYLRVFFFLRWQVTLT